MKSADVKPAAAAKKGSGKPFFTGAGEAVQEQQERPAFFNQGKGKPIQAKLSIGKAGDSYEKEADKTADRVVMRLAPPVQTKCAQCEQKEKLQKEQEKEAPEKQKIRKKPIFDSNAEPPPADKDDANIRRCAVCGAEGEQKVQKKDDFESRLNASKGGGSPLPAGTREQMESSMGADFSGVRVHTDSQAAEMSSSIHAQAFTHGGDIYFNSGKYNPQNKDGQHLLAH